MHSNTYGACSIRCWLARPRAPTPVVHGRDFFAWCSITLPSVTEYPWLNAQLAQKDRGRCEGTL